MTLLFKQSATVVMANVIWKAWCNVTNRLYFQTAEFTEFNHRTHWWLRGDNWLPEKQQKQSNRKQGGSHDKGRLTGVTQSPSKASIR